MRDANRPRPPEPRIERALARLAAAGRLRGPALDVASGDGRHAITIARRGLPTLAVDRDGAALARLRARARALSLPVLTLEADLEVEPPPKLERDAWGLIVVVHYLHRRLCPALTTALAPGGVLLYETFTRLHATIGRPTNPAFLLRPRELLRLFAALEVIDYEEGERRGPSIKATLVARRRP